MNAHVLKGMASYIPGVLRFYRQSKGSGGTDNARYCYSVWLRHLVLAYKNGLPAVPRVIAELGPGDSLGIGLAALLSGSEKYYAFDAVKFINEKKNLEVLDELINLFRRHEPIPGEYEFPKVRPRLESYDFPEYILTENLLRESLGRDRLMSIRNALLKLSGGNRENAMISYLAGWYDSTLVKAGTVDMVYSQAVLEHVDDLPHTYDVLAKWMKPNGLMSHVIDFNCHKTANKWNGHWAYSDFTWRLIRGKRPYLLNRQPHSTHISLLEKNSFKIVSVIREKDLSGIARKSLSSGFKYISDDDLTTRTSFIQALKK